MIMGLLADLSAIAGENTCTTGGWVQRTDGPGYSHCAT